MFIEHTIIHKHCKYTYTNSPSGCTGSDHDGYENATILTGNRFMKSAQTGNSQKWPEPAQNGQIQVCMNIAVERVIKTDLFKILQLICSLYTFHGRIHDVFDNGKQFIYSNKTPLCTCIFGQYLVVLGNCI